jgi:hypothetical protein
MARNIPGYGGGGGATDTGLLIDWDLTAIDAGTTWSSTGTKSLGGITSWNVRNVGVTPTFITIDGTGLNLSNAAELTVDDITELIPGFDAQGKILEMVVEFDGAIGNGRVGVMIGPSFTELLGVDAGVNVLKAMRKNGGAFQADVNSTIVSANVHTMGALIMHKSCSVGCDSGAVNTAQPRLPLDTPGAATTTPTADLFGAAGGLLRFKGNSATIVSIRRIQLYERGTFVS